MRAVFIALVVSGSAFGANVLDQALPGPGLAVAVYNLGNADALVNEVAERFGGGPSVDGLVSRLRARRPGAVTR